MVFAAMLIAGSPVAAWAHAGLARTLPQSVAATPPRSVPLVADAQPVWASAQPAPIDATTLVIIGVGLAAALMTIRRSQHVVAIGISGLLVLVGFAAAVHSVHHLGSSDGADRCVLAASAEHVNGIDTEGVPLSSVATVAIARAWVVPSACPRDTSFAPTCGRAPPA